MKFLAYDGFEKGIFFIVINLQSISPGLVRTEIIDAKMLDAMKWPELTSEDISQAVLYVLGTPPHVQIAELTIKPVGEIF